MQTARGSAEEKVANQLAAEAVTQGGYGLPALNAHKFTVFGSGQAIGRLGHLWSEIRPVGLR
jgi:hypothetical protein